MCSNNVYMCYLQDPVMESLLAEQEGASKAKKKKKPSKPKDPKEKKEKKEKSPRKRKKKGEESRTESDPLPELTLDEGLDFPKPEIPMLDGDTSNLSAGLADSNEGSMHSATTGTPVPSVVGGAVLSGNDGILSSSLPSILNDVECTTNMTDGEQSAPDQKTQRKRDRKKKENKDQKTLKESKPKKEKKAKDSKMPKTPRKRKKKDGDEEKDDGVEKGDAETGDEAVGEKQSKPAKVKTLAKPKYAKKKK